MADPDLSVPLSTLICNEDGARLDDETDYEVDENEEEEDNGLQMACSDSFNLEAGDEYVEMLLSKETRFSDSNPRDSSFEESLRPIRSDSIRWILNTSKSFGFNPKTVYMAVAYFDQFFKHRTIDIVEGKAWAVKLLAVACLSLAAKMEEREAPPLSVFQAKEYPFSCQAIRRMELLILSTLEWKMSPVTPFTYLSYFATKSKKNGSKDLVSNAVKFIFAIIEVMNSMDHRPSILAVAAVLAALDEGLTQETVESKMSFTSYCGSLDIEEVFFCYKLMIQESQKEKLKAKQDMASSYQSSLNAGSINSSVDAIGTTISFALASSKRRRMQ